MAREDISYWLTETKKNFLRRKVHKVKVKTQSSVNIAGMVWRNKQKIKVTYIQTKQNLSVKY